MFKAYVIESRRGFVALPEKIGTFSFPLSFGSKVAATQFPFKSAAAKMIKKYKLDLFPHNAHIEEIEIN
jgi:hypothetical protein